MKKFLLLLILCFIKLNAYEYLLGQRLINQDPKIIFFIDVDGVPKQKVVKMNGTIKLENINNYLYYYLNNIRNNSTINNFQYVEKNVFDSYYKNDLIFLDNLYNYSLNQFLNYLYNANNFTESNYILYENYQLLYNEDGFVVASIVNSQWDGLYDNSTMGNSGYLYNSNGSLLYIDGQEPTFFQKIWSNLSKPLLKDFKDANNGLIPLRWIVSFIIVFMLVFFVVRLIKNIMGVEKWKI